MVWWWIGNAVFLLVVIPVVVLMLQRLIRPTREIRRYADDVLEHGLEAVAALDAVDDLVTTKDLVADTRAGLERYGRAARDLRQRKE